MKPNAQVLAQLDTPVMNFMVDKNGRKMVAKAGEVGIEIEVEGANLLKEPSKWWNNIPDGSLRGESAEYVLAKPIERKNVADALNLLSNELIVAGSRIDDSYRTSVHVHLNMLKTPLRHLYNHMCLYLIVEDLLLEFCGKERVGNLFCLRAKDAEFLVEVLKQVLHTAQYRNFALNDLRYAAMNVKALSDHGSLEFRAFRGTVNPVLIKQWVDILLEIKDAAARYNNPQEICRDVSVKGPIQFLTDIFSRENLRVLLDQPDVDKVVFEGVRLVQDIAYAIPTWDTLVVPDEDAFPVKGAPRKKNPFDVAFQEAQQIVVGRGGGGAAGIRPLGDGIQWARMPPAEIVGRRPAYVIADDLMDDDFPDFDAPEPEEDEDF